MQVSLTVVAIGDCLNVCHSTVLCVPFDCLTCAMVMQVSLTVVATGDGEIEKGHPAQAHYSPD